MFFQKYLSHKYISLLEKMKNENKNKQLALK